MAIDYEKLFAGFKSESLEQLDQAESAILNLEKNQDPETVNNLFRTIHTIKGNSGLFDLPRLTQLAHSFENVLNLLRNGEMTVSMEVIDLMLLSIDRLREMIQDIQNSENYDISDLVGQLTEVFKEHKGEAPAAAPTGGSAGPAPAADKQESAPGPSDQAAGSNQPQKKGSEAANAGFRFKIGQKLLDKGAASRANVSIVIANLVNQKYKTLSEFKSLVAKLRADKLILKAGILTSQLPPLQASEEEQDEEAADFLPWYFLFFTPVTKTIEAVLHEYDIRPAYIQKILVSGQPPAADTEAESPDGETTDSGGEIAPAESGPGTGEAKKDGSAPVRQAAGDDGYLKVSTKLIDELINLAGENIIARNELIQKIEIMENPELDVTGKKVSRLITMLQESIMKTRLQELEAVFSRIPRIIRDVTRQTNKEVELEVLGGNIELDKNLIDAIMDPLTHLIRNSIDHGIEDPVERENKGKPREGLLKVSGSLSGGNVLLKIEDDGRGLNTEKLRQTAVTRRLMTPEQAKNASVAEIHELVFQPGFSTAEKVTKTSGRGVGMDVVRTNIQKIGGNVEIESQPDQGTQVRITLPQSLTIITCLLVRSGNQRFALPQKNIEELIQIDPKAISDFEGHPVYELRGRLVPLVDLRELLDLEETRKPQFIVSVVTDRHRFGVMVDEIINPEEFVVKPLGRFFADLQLYSGAGIMGDGEAILVLDVPGIARQTRLQPNRTDESEQVLERGLADTDSGFLLFEVYGQQFALPSDSLPRLQKINHSDIETFMGFEIYRQNENEIIPLVRLDRWYGLNRGQEPKIWYIIFVQYEDRHLGILATEIHNVVDEVPQLETSVFKGHAIRGEAVVGGHTTGFLDTKELIEEFTQNRNRELDSLWEAEMRATRQASREALDTGTPVTPDSPQENEDATAGESYAPEPTRTPTPPAPENNEDPEAARTENDTEKIPETVPGEG